MNLPDIINAAQAGAAKDPLNRFDGLFDGRTYGNGRFVLIEGVEYEGLCVFEGDIVSYPYGMHMVVLREESCDCFGYIYGIRLSHFKFSKYSNIYENPELWEKVK